MEHRSLETLERASGTLVKKVKESNVELMRILAMLMITISHCIQHSNIMSELSSGNYFAMRFLYLIVKIANALFILASGYFSIHSKFNITKILKLWGRVLFYSVGIYMIYTILGLQTDAYDAFFPILSGQYWFITAYIAIYFLGPILSFIVNKLTKNQFRYLLIVVFAFFVVINMTFNPVGLFAGIGAFLCVYLLGAYIRLHVEIKRKKGYYFLKAVMIYIITLIIGLLVEFVLIGCGDSLNIHLKSVLLQINAKTYDFVNVGLIFTAMFVFLKFKTLDIKNRKLSRTINFVSASVFSIYLIHENVNNRWIWTKLFNPLQYSQSPILVVYIIAIALCVFVVCLLIDFIRRRLFYMLKKVSFVSKFLTRLNEKLDFVNQKVNAYLS